MNVSRGRKERAALRAARRGWAVFPVHWIDRGKCSCGNPTCSNPGKHPLTSHGVKDATTDKSLIRKWWHKYPLANVGVATGQQSGIVVLDVDNRHGGFKSLRQLEREHGPLPDGPTVRTGSGGFHHYFASPAVVLRNRVGLFPGVDLRADSAYVVGPCSTHASGKDYLWVHGKTPEQMRLPALPTWLETLLVETKSATRSPTFVIEEGRRNSTLASLAGTMQMRGMSAQAIEAALIEENHARCAPPLPDDEVRQIAASISRYPSRESEDLIARKPLPFRSVADLASEVPPQIPWIAPPWVAIGSITGVHGKPKDSGKTTFMMHLARKVLEGATFMGIAATKTGVVYLSEERPTSLIQALQRANLTHRDDITVLLSHESRGWSWPELVRAAVIECKSRGAHLLVIDTFAQFAGFLHGEENSAGDVLDALKPLQEAAASGLAVVIVHHERKSGGLVSDSGRGSSATAGAADIVISIRHPEGHHKRNVRLLQTVSRFSETPSELQIELTDEGYCSLGAPREVAKEQAALQLLALIPTSKKKAVTIDVLMEKTRNPRAHVQRLLDVLADQGKVLRRGKGRKNDPYRYFAL
jgi:hypothetical protein